MSQNNLSKLALSVAEDLELIPGINTLKTIGSILIYKVDDTSSLFKEILVDSERDISDLSEREKKEFYEECYLIYQYTVQGKAQHNIKLLIKYLKSQLKNGSELYIKDFHQVMDILANLTDYEIKFIIENKDKKTINLCIPTFLDGIWKRKVDKEHDNLSIAYSLQGKGLIIIDTEHSYASNRAPKLVRMMAYKTKIYYMVFNNIEGEL